MHSVALHYCLKNRVLEQRPLTGDLIEGRFADPHVEFLVALEGMPTGTHDLAGPGDIAQLVVDYGRGQNPTLRILPTDSCR